MGQDFLLLLKNIKKQILSITDINIFFLYCAASEYALSALQLLKNGIGNNTVLKLLGHDPAL